MQYNTNFYWGKSPQQNNITVPTCTIVHPCLDITTVTKVKIPKNVCDKNQACKAMQSCPICLTGSDYDYIIDEIKRRDAIEYKRKRSVDNS